MLSSQGLVLATAMAVSAGTIIILDLLRDKYFPHNQDSFPQKQRILRPCLTSSSSSSSSGDKKKESEKKKKKKRVHFAEDVKDTIGNGEEYRRQFETVKQRRCSYGNVGNNGMPANRAALYAGVLKDRVHRIQYSY